MRKEIFRVFIAFGAFISLILIFGCSATQTMDLTFDGNSNLSLRLEFEPFFTEYLRDLGSGGTEEVKVFDAQAIRIGFSEYPGILVQDVRVEDQRILHLDLQVRNVQGVVEDQLEIPDFIRFESLPAGQRVEFTISRDLVRRLLGATPFADSDSIDYLLPAPDQRVSAEDYTEDLVWIFEEYEPGDSLRRILAQAQIELIIKTPADIRLLAGPGLTQVSSRQSRLLLPVIPLLTDAPPRVYRIEF